METHPYATTNGFQKQLEMSEKEIQKGAFKSGGIWDEKTKTIICGTFPPLKEYNNRKGYIHYSSPKNKFWSHIDAIFDTRYYINTKEAYDVHHRIQNALKKIKFLINKEVGFVDIYTKIERKIEGSSKDDDLECVETIFENGIFESILKSDVNQIAFVYCLARNEFIKAIKEAYSVIPVVIREYKKDDITLEVKKVTIGNKVLFLSYCPIHGNIRDIHRRPALAKVIKGDFS
ncbi:hypothetical protein SAMN06298216_4378 [Spirosomataceae bacterium TFI 002]|nr:hypothetical protein SAMN06298216_4378 [Spirosomataceae bacterium TFI 002]